MKIIFSKLCLEYSFPKHPESPQRVSSSYNLLKEKFEFVEPEYARQEDILSVHDKILLDKVKSGDFLDSDTPNSKDIYKYALLSCGAAIKAQEIALNKEFAFSLMRPPGHHASRNMSQGFCYFNNVAVAVCKALKTVKRVAIIDIDCHHGNGTQDIFLGNQRVLYISLHQSPLYPGTGLKSYENCINYPLPPGTDEKCYLTIFKDAIGKVREFSPQLIAVSAGFDTYKNDPLTDFNLEKETYAKISNLVFSLNIPVFSVLEGGYSLELAQCIEQYLSGFK